MYSYAINLAKYSLGQAEIRNRSRSSLIGILALNYYILLIMKSLELKTKKRIAFLLNFTENKIMLFYESTCKIFYCQIVKGISFIIIFIIVNIVQIL